MPNKRLADLLQEEAQKFTPSQDDSVIEVTAEKVIETDISASEENAVKTPSVNSAKSKTPTKADLENTIKDLTATLEKSAIQETTLRQEITDLQKQLTEQKALAERLAKELYETKKTALQLAESNSKLIEENKELKNQPVKESVKEPVHQEPVKEISKSLAINPRKAYKPPEIVVDKTQKNKDDFADKTWLYD